MRHSKKFITLLFVLFILLSEALQLQAVAQPGDDPVTNGKSVVLMDAASGRVLYEKNSHQRLPEASLTKIMTAFLTVEDGNLDQVVAVSKHAASTPECSIYLESGEKLTRMELLYGAMLHSGNDAAVALAESVAGDEKKFVALMNQRAWELGMKDTHFGNPHGLQTTGHYSSAYDLALLSSKALNEPDFAQVVATERKLIPWAGHDEDRVLINMNRLLYRYEGTIGVKTGYTKEAGNCVVGAAQKGDMVLIAVSMNSTTVYDDLQQLLDYGFGHYQMVSLAQADDASIELEVTKGEKETITAIPAQDLKIAVTPEEIPNLRYTIVPREQINAPVKEGESLGLCTLYIDDEQVGTIDLLASQAVNETPVSFYQRLIICLLGKWYSYLLLLMMFLLVYKTRNKITWTECLRRILRVTVGSIIVWQRRRKSKKFRQRPRNYYRNDR